MQVKSQVGIGVIQSAKWVFFLIYLHSPKRFSNILQQNNTHKNLKDNLKP